MRGVMCTGSNLQYLEEDFSFEGWRWTQIAQYQTSIGKKMEEEEKVGFHLISSHRHTASEWRRFRGSHSNSRQLGNPWALRSHSEDWNPGCANTKAQTSRVKTSFFPPKCYVISFTDDIGKRTNPRHGAGDQTMATIPEKTKLGNHSA